MTGSFDALVTQRSDVLWSQAFLALKPGAAVLVHIFNGQVSRPALALRRAGFEFRDTILYNTGLECSLILFFRKPIAEPSVAQQVLTTGTGALNLDAVRVKGIVPAPTKTRVYRRFDNKYHDNDSTGAPPVLKDAPTPSDGRWPPNYIFQHGPDCRSLGKVQTCGFEVDKFDCHPPCMVPTIERQSADQGVLGSKTSDGYADDGAAGRIFPKLLSREELLDWLKRLALPPGGTLYDPFA